MRPPLTTGMAAIAVAALIALPLIAAGPALAADDLPTTDALPAGETTSLVVVEPPADAAPVAPGPTPASTPEAPAAVAPEPSAASTTAPETPDTSRAAPAGEQEAPTDKTPPEYVAVTPAQDELFRGNGTEHIDFRCFDEESGIEDCALYDHNDQPQTVGEPLKLPTGRYTWTGVAVNSAGLRSDVVIEFSVQRPDDPKDTTPPSFTSTTPVANAVYTGAGDEIVGFECADPESIVLRCTLHDENWTRIENGSALDLPEGDYTWTGVAVSVPGLTTSQEISFSVRTPDTTLPEVSSDWDIADGDWSNRKTLKVTATGSVADISKIHVRYDGAQEWNSDTAEVELVHGSRTLEFWAVDKAGNESEHKTLQLNIDLGLPTITVDSEIAPDGLSPVEVIQGSTVPFSYTCTDDYSGVAKCTSAYPSGRALPTGELGEHGFTVDAFDNAGNRTTRMFRYVVVAPTDPVDTSAPSFTATTPAMNGVYTGSGDEYVDFSCADVESGIEKCGMWDQDGDPVAVGAPLELADGDYTWTGIAVNSIGLRTTQVIQFKVRTPDTTRPEVSSDWDVPAGEWSNRDKITITATDSGSGISGIWASFNGSTFVNNEETFEFEPEQGSQTVEFWAVDSAGNESEHEFIDVDIDRDKPEIQADSVIAPAGLTAEGIAPVEVKKGATVPFSYTCTDALSGVDACASAHASGDALPTDDLGEHKFTVDAFDKAGNRTTRAFAYVVVAASDPTDTTAPSFAGITPAVNGVYKGTGEESIDFACADAESGIEKCALTDHDGNQVAVGAPLELAAGDYTWTGIAVNAVGLTTTQSIKFSVKKPDTTRPEVSSDWDVADGDWSNRDALRIAATDGGSGVGEIHVRYDGGMLVWNTEKAEIDLVPGSQPIEFWAVDEAGNESEHKTLQLNIDHALPEIQASSEIAPEGLAVVEVTQGSTVPFSFACTDALSGVDGCSSGHASGDALPTDELGEHTFSVDAVDKAGNRTSRVFAYVVIAASDPTDPTDPTDGSGADGGDTPGGLATTGLAQSWLPAIAITLLVLGAGVIVACRRIARV